MGVRMRRDAGKGVGEPGYVSLPFPRVGLRWRDMPGRAVPRLGLEGRAQESCPAPVWHCGAAWGPATRPWRFGTSAADVAAAPACVCFGPWTVIPQPSADPARPTRRGSSWPVYADTAVTRFR